MRAARQSSSQILVVQGDALSRELLLQLLRMAGLDALAATTGEQGLLLLRKRRHEIGWLFTDLELPSLVCGAMLADEFHQSHPARPAVVARASAPALLTEIPGVVWLQRPVSPLDVLETIKALRVTFGSGSNAPALSELRKAA